MRGITKYQRREQHYTLDKDKFLDALILIVCLWILFAIITGEL